MNKPTRKSSRIKSSSSVIPKESPVDSCPNSKGASKEPELNSVVSSKRRKTKEPSEGPLLNTSNSVDNNKSNNKREVVQPEEGSRRSTRRRDAESMGNKHKLLVDGCLNGTAIKRFDYETLVEMFDKRIKPSKNASCRSKQIITVEVDDKTFEMSKRDFFKVGIDESIIRSDTEESDEKNEKINGDILLNNENGDESSKEVIDKDNEKDNFREEEKESVNDLTFSNSEMTKSEDDINNKPVKVEESIPSTSNDISFNTSEAVSDSLPTTSVTDEETVVSSQVVKAFPSVECSSNTSTLPENDNTNLETDIDVDNQVSESQNEIDMSKIKQNNLPVSNNDVCSSEVMDADVSSLSDSPSTNDSGSVKETASEIIASIKEELMTVENQKESTLMEVDDIIDTAISSKVATPVKSSPASNVSTPSKPVSLGKLALNTPIKMLSPQNLKSPNKLTSPMKVQLTSSPKVISGMTSNIETIESPKTVELLPQEDGHINGEIKSTVGPTEALKIIITDSTGSGTSTAPNSSIPSDTPMMVPSSNSNVEIVKSESSIYKRVKQLKEQGLWSQARLPQVEEPKPQIIHWDFLLEEMAWMWSDFVRERKMKKQNRKNISRAIKKLQSKIEGKDEEDEKAQRIRAEKMANRVAKEIRKFWEGAAKLVTMKEEIILKRKRQEIRRKNMDKIVDQANIFSNQVGQTLQGGSVEPDEYIMDEESNYNTLFSNDVNETDELNELDALVKSQNAPLSDILRELPPEYLAEVQGMSTSFNYNHNDTSISEIIPAKKRKIEELPEDELTLSSSGDQIDEDNSNMLASSESSKAKITNFEKMREECQTLQPQGFTLESAHINVEQPSMIRGVLREYQLLGLNWLYTLFKRHVNGILADEMGLGKTLQTISLLAYLVEKERIWRPHLIIVPTSVILNWDMEFKKWCPNFKTLVYHGTAKERGDLRKGWTKDDSFDVVITSYKIIINDINVFRKRKWQYLILDEAHTIKNFKSQAWQKLVNLKSMNRLLLTGTPLQNDLMELHSLLKFLMPTIFTSQSDFKEVFNDPLVDFAGGSGDSNPELVGKLHDILRPFLLRRLKKDVEKQLPKKREIVVRCSLANRQRSLYDDFICRRETQALLASGSIFHVLNVTMQLRKVCNHPNLHETRSVESPVVLFTIRVPYPAIVFDIAQPVIDQKLRNLPTCLIFNGNRSYSIRALSCLRKIKCTRQEYASNLSTHTHAIPKLKGFKLNFHNFISTKMYNRDNLKNGQRLFDLDMDNIVMLHMKVGDEFVLSFDDDEIDRIPLVLKDKKPLLCKIEVDPTTKKPGMYVVNCDHVVFPTKLQELQFSRNTRNDFILIKKGEAEARKLRFHGIDHKNFSSFVQLPKNYSTKALLNFRAVSAHYNNKKITQGGSTIKKEPIQVDNDVVMENIEENEEKDFKTPEYFTYLRTLNPDDFVDKRAREQQLLEKENCADMISTLSVERISNIRDPLIYGETICLLKREFSENLELKDHSVLFNWLDYDKSVDMYNKRFLEDLLDGCVDKFDIYTYSAISRGVKLVPVGKGRNYDIINEMENIEKMSKEVYDNLDIYYHKLETSAMFSFPELRLIEYDCGKLQRLTIMLRELFTQGHRVLIFTQMSSMLDILQEFLSYHGYKYFRLDGSTPLDQRQAMMEQFNNDNKIFCFILSTRSGGIGINLTGADTVIFYDSDWNPTMDAQAQDRCHRIGQTKDVTIYRLISEYTIEEAILERATMKRKLGEMAIDNAKFTPDYFRNMNIKDLFRDNIQSLDKEIIESKVEVASDNEIRKALALTEDKVDANAAELAEKEAATEHDEILPNSQGYDDQEINEELKPYVESLTDVEKYAVKYLQQLNDPELQKRLEEIEINDQLDVIENTNEHKESTEGFDEVSSKKNRKRINPNNVLPSRASERISRVALNKIIEAEDREAFAKVKRICKVKDKSSKKSSISSNTSHSRGRDKKNDKISKRSNKNEGKNPTKKRRNIKNNTSNIDVIVKDECSSNNSKPSKTINNSNVTLSSTTKSLVSPPTLPPKLSSSRLIKQPCTNNVSFTPPKPIVKSSTLVSNFASQNLPIRSDSPKTDYTQNGGRIFCAKLSKNVSTVIKPPRKCYNTLPISKPPVRQPIFRNTPISLNSNISQTSNTNNKPPDVKRVVYICVKNNSQNTTTNQVLPRVCSYISSTQKINVPSLPPSRNPLPNFAISRSEPRPLSSLRITNNTSVTQRIPISNNSKIFTIQRNNDDKPIKTTSP
uniref:E1A-binding protein p400 (inferred by orthology to a human protein) n=1 Tax=Strongyloides venezuelensis TaxID=75913 RepID=A0A0K0G120_STRVS